ncbi:unnamed protein product [Lepeophtheirus salmonis]|uniref:(salmon louse) hypothetical protein n=1 Tax=Lepeophtheirus salmonis TaxID=72036 RepID=A0A7R8CKZ1_LEPSM|nr:unnamed protein product [Lepeophtheirus salmonis]CAF2849240.1 unnamed protein product [Lepeophtheirus salmonis]
MIPDFLSTIEELKKYIQSLCETDDTGVRTLKPKLIHSINKRFEEHFVLEKLPLSTAADPRFKAHGFPDTSSREKAKDLLCQRIKNIMEERAFAASHHKADSMHAATDKEDIPKNKKKKLWDTLSDSEEEDNQILHPIVYGTRIDETLALYWEAQICCKDLCPLSYRPEPNGMIQLGYFREENMPLKFPFCKGSHPSIGNDPYFKLLFHTEELMVVYKETRAGNLRQYIKSKPYKWGYKLFCRVSIDGFIHNILMYQEDATFSNHHEKLNEYENNFLVSSKVFIVLAKTVTDISQTTIWG